MMCRCGHTCRSHEFTDTTDCWCGCPEFRPVEAQPGPDDDEWALRNMVG
jgi:hypothetical protein